MYKLLHFTHLSIFDVLKCWIRATEKAGSPRVIATWSTKKKKETHTNKRWFLLISWSCCCCCCCFFGDLESNQGSAKNKKEIELESSQTQSQQQQSLESRKPQTEQKLSPTKFQKMKLKHQTCEAFFFFALFERWPKQVTTCTTTCTVGRKKDQNEHTEFCKKSQSFTEHNFDRTIISRQHKRLISFQVSQPQLSLSSPLHCRQQCVLDHLLSIWTHNTERRTRRQKEAVQSEFWNVSFDSPTTTTTTQTTTTTTQTTTAQTTTTTTQTTTNNNNNQTTTTKQQQQPNNTKQPNNNNNQATKHQTTTQQQQPNSLPINRMTNERLWSLQRGDNSSAWCQSEDILQQQYFDMIQRLQLHLVFLLLDVVFVAQTSSDFVNWVWLCVLFCFLFLKTVQKQKTKKWKHKTKQNKRTPKLPQWKQKTEERPTCSQRAQLQKTTPDLNNKIDSVKNKNKQQNNVLVCPILSHTHKQKNKQKGGFLEIDGSSNYRKSSWHDHFVILKLQKTVTFSPRNYLLIATTPIVSKRLCQQNNAKTTTNIFSPQSPSPKTIGDCSQITETQLVPEQTNNFSTQEYCEMLSKLASQAAETIPKPIWPNTTNILELVNHVLEKADDKNAVENARRLFYEAQFAAMNAEHEQQMASFQVLYETLEPVSQQHSQNTLNQEMAR